MKKPIPGAGLLPAPWSFKENQMIIRNNLAKQVKVILNGKEFVFNSGAEIEVSDREGEFILMLQPMLTIKKETVIHSEPAEIVKKEEPKAKKNVVKNKKSRK